MLLARDMNGRRIYDSRTDLAAALNVGAIHTAEQFEGLVREDDDGNRHKLLEYSRVRAPDSRVSMRYLCWLKSMSN